METSLSGFRLRCIGLGIPIAGEVDKKGKTEKIVQVSQVLPLWSSRL